MELIVTPPETLRAIVCDAIKQHLQSFLKARDAQQAGERMGVNEVLQYLRGQSYVTTKGNIYNMVANKRIPHAKINGKLVFEQKAINRWLEAKLEVIK